MRTKRMFIVALISCSFWVNAKAEEQPTLRINLDQAVAIALDQSNTVMIADVEIKRKDYSKKESIAGLFPQIGFAAQYARTIKKQVMVMDFGGKTQEIAMGIDNQYSGGFSAQLPIIAPTLWASIQLTQIDMENAIEKARSSKLSLINSVEKAYYTLLISQDSYEVLKRSYDNAKLNALNFKNKFDQGMASEYDVLRADVQVRNQEPGLLQAENGVSLANLRLKVLMNVDIATTIETATTLSDYEQDMYARAIETSASQIDLSNNTNLKQLEIQMRMLKKSETMAKLAYSPTLSGSINYNWMSLNNNFDLPSYRWFPTSTAGIALSIPLFQGGARALKVKQAKLNMMTLKYNADDVMKNLSMQAQSSLDNIQKSVKQVASNKEGVKQAERAYSIMQKSFEVGSANIINLNDADLALTTSRLSYYQAIYDYLSAQSDLQLLLGENPKLDAYNKAKSEAQAEVKAQKSTKK